MFYLQTNAIAAREGSINCYRAVSRPLVFLVRRDLTTRFRQTSAGALARAV